MSIIATIMSSATGLPIQKMPFGRMPKLRASFNFTTGELVKAERDPIGEPARGNSWGPVKTWAALKA